MEWPSKSVPYGGVFQPPKVQYSQETKNYLKRKFLGILCDWYVFIKHQNYNILNQAEIIIAIVQISNIERS